jgi:hypothetical protein
MEGRMGKNKMGTNYVNQVSTKLSGRFGKYYISSVADIDNSSISIACILSILSNKIN